MSKVTITWNAVRTAPTYFWVCLLLSSALLHLVPSQVVAKGVKSTLAAEKVRGTAEPATADAANLASALPLNQENKESQAVPDSLAPEDVAPITVSEAPVTAEPITSVAQLNLEQGSHSDDAQGIAAPTLEGADSEEPLTIEQVTSVADLESGEEGQVSGDSMKQVTNISQLSDVQPTDWAYEALQSLVERYGCIAGYPNGTFRGNRALSRYEFAAGLNACLAQIEKLIDASSGDFVTKEDLVTLQRLVEEFGAELATLRTRVDNLEGRVTVLEENQFSTTTKLNALAWFNLTGAFADDDVKVETSNIDPPLELRPAGRNSLTGRPIIQNAEDPNITLSNLVWLTLETTFTGKDSLVTQLAAGNGVSPANAYASAGLFNTFGVPFFDQTAGTEVTDPRNDVILRELFYRFPVSDKFQVVVGPRINWYRYFDNNAFTFILTGANTFNSNGSSLSNTIDRGAGAVVLWDINKQFKLRAGYLGESDEFLPSQFGFNTASNPGKGVFGGTNTASAELTFSPSDKLNLRLLYNYSHIDPNSPIFDENGNLTGIGIGGAPGEPVYGVADDGFGGSLRTATANSFGVNFDWLVTPGIGLFGRYTYGTTNINPRNSSRQDGSIEAQSLQLGLAFPDLGKKGALATLSYLIPFSVLDGHEFLAAGGGDRGVQFEFEANYFFPLTNNISIVPAFYVIANPNNFSDNPTIFVGNLRTQFSF